MACDICVAPSRALALLLFLAFPPVSSALRNGDNFSNNVFTDLGPILALFGEQAGSLGWADNILFLMVIILQCR